MPFTVGVVYSCVTACLRLGAPVIAGAFTDPATMAEALNAHAITHLTLLPFQLQLVLDNLPQGFDKPRGLMIFALGAAVSEVLRKRALDRLATELCSGYGCNEVGIISFTSLGSPDQIESICPGVVVEVLDEQGQALPPGKVGEIRVRTPCMAQSYIGDPETSRRMFRDGWFYPGDVGVLHGLRCLQVIGRVDEILNIGGAKSSPETLEELILARTPIRQAGVCSIRNSAGIEEVCVAVADAAGGDQELVDWITRAFHGVQIGAFRVARLPVIPRNAAGKIQPNHFGVVDDLNAAFLRGRIVGIQQGFTAAEEKSVGAIQMEGAAEGGLEARAVAAHPSRGVRGFPNRQPRQLLIGLATGDRHEVGEVLGFRVGSRDAHVAGVAAVSASEVARSAFENDDPRASLACLQSCAQTCIAAAHDGYVEFKRILVQAYLWPPPPPP